MHVTVLDGSLGGGSWQADFYDVQVCDVETFQRLAVGSEELGDCF